MDNKSNTHEHESLYTIMSIINLCLTGVEVLSNESTENKNLKSKLYLIVSSYYMISLNNFLDEWHKHFITTSKIKNFKRRLKPIIVEIKSFKDIKMARNTIFAHNRDSKNNNSNPLLTDIDISYNIPISVHDFSYVTMLLEIIKYELTVEFKNEFIELESYRRSSSKIKEVKKRFNNKDEVLAKVQELKSLIKI